MTSFLPYFIDNIYYQLTKPAGQNPVRDRSLGFLKIITLLEIMDKDHYAIFESGTIRPDHGVISWGDDGASTVLFDKFLDVHKGGLLSVDINQKNIDHGKSLTKHVTYFCSDSIDFIKSLKPEVKFDLVYLDSYDFTLADADKSRMYQLNEFKAIEKNCEKGTIVASDDFILPDTDIRGKGEFLKIYLDAMGATLIHEGYQLIYML